MNKFPSDFHPPLTGFGGDSSKNQAQNKAALKRTPVVLVHGNAANSVDPTFGMQKMAVFLKEIGYQDCEIWAMDYLGENNSQVQLQGVHRQHIDVFRTFVDRVRDYLGVGKLDFIAHSLGCGMVNGYLRGYQSNGKFNNEDNRFDVAGTVVNLAGAISGLGFGGVDEFKTGSEFEIESHNFKGTKDDTPFGSKDKEKQISPDQNWIQVTSLDNGQTRYVSLIAKGDFVDAQNTDTGHRNGADLNKRYNLGSGAQGHEAIIKSQTVFDDLKPYLNQSPPQPRVKISVDKDNGNFGPSLEIRVAVEPANIPVNCTAKRLTKEFQSGTIVEKIAETDTRTLTNGQSLTLAHDGAWEVVFSASGTEDVTRNYGVNVRIPEVTILTDNSTPFKGSLTVEASATKGRTYFSTDKKLWNEGVNNTIHETSTIYFMAIDADGLPSAIVSRDFERQPVISATASLTEHFMAHRIDVAQFVELLQRFGPLAKVTLYSVNDKWVLDPATPEVSAKAPVIDVSVDSGTHTQPITVAVAAHHQTDAAPTIHYTLDGSLPTEHSPAFSSSGLLRLDKAGTSTIQFRARDAFGNWSDVEKKTYTMNIKDAQPSISADRDSGEYSEGFNVTIAASAEMDKNVTVYYTLNGSDPTDPHNPDRRSFVDRGTFSLKSNGNYAISCYAKDSAGNETLRSFAWQVNDQQYPETSLSPAMGGVYVGGVDVELSPSEKCAWTKYTTDGSIPSETNGIVYSAPIRIGDSTVLKFRSKDIQGNLEPPKTATFVITPKTPQAVFDNRAERDGYVRAKPDGSDAFVGTFENLEIGSSRDGKESRAILYFDTSSLPDNAIISKAYLEVKLHLKHGDPWADRRKIAIDVKNGCFGSSRAVQIDDWGDAATAEGAGHIGKFTSGMTQSSEFSQEGMESINTTGPTQIRLRLEPPHSSPSNSLFIKGGAEAKLFVEYSD